MDYQEAIKELRNNLNDKTVEEIPEWAIVIAEKINSALEDLLEYQKLGTLEEMKMLKETHLTGVELAELYCAVKNLSEYKKLGTLQQVRDAVEKQKEERPRPVLGTFGGEEYECKNCGNPVEYLDEYCRCCGQKQDWSE